MPHQPWFLAVKLSPAVWLLGTNFLGMTPAVAQTTDVLTASELPPVSTEASELWPTAAGAITAQTEPLDTPPAATPEPEPPRDPMVLYDDGSFTVRSHLQFGLNAVTENNLFWNLADTFAPQAQFEGDKDWLELYIKPGLSFTGLLEDDVTLTYGKLSFVGSYTVNPDAYDVGDTGRVTLEEGYLGVRTLFRDRVNVDFSFGPRELKLGTGMLIANGASNGFERGALKFGPRKAWELAAIARIFGGDVQGQVFFLDPNELPSNDGRNELAGVDVRYDSPEGDYVGFTYANVVNSRSAYPQAAPGGNGPPNIIQGARDGLNSTNFYARVTPFQGDLEPLFLTTDLAYQWNDRINQEAWAGRFQIGYTFNDVPWSPTLTYSFQSFSGDNPATGRLERFDPLYYEGSPSSWATGSKSSMVFINSNVQAHQIALRLSPSPQDTVTLRYAHIRANELRSPVQFGQATRFDFSNGVASVISGVSDAHLSDDIFLEYSRIINRNIFLTAGVSISFPGSGIDNVLAVDAPNWHGGFVNVVFNF